MIFLQVERVFHNHVQIGSYNCSADESNLVCCIAIGKNHEPQTLLFKNQSRTLTLIVNKESQPEPNPPFQEPEPELLKANVFTNLR